MRTAACLWTLVWGGGRSNAKGSVLPRWGWIKATGVLAWRKRPCGLAGLLGVQGLFPLLHPTPTPGDSAGPVKCVTPATTYAHLGPNLATRTF